MMYNCCFSHKTFREFGIFGYVANSNIFTRIFGHLPVLSDLGLGLVLILRILNIPRIFNEGSLEVQGGV
jgi:hypothetical protein